MSRTVIIGLRPECDFCAITGQRAGTPARFDFRTKSGYWANGCTSHYVEHRASQELGTGNGQMFVTACEMTDEAELLATALELASRTEVV